MSLVRLNWEILPRPSTHMIIHYAIRSPTAAIRQLTAHTHTYTCKYINRVATGQGKVREIQGQQKVREFFNLSEIGILFKLREKPGNIS